MARKIGINNVLSDKFSDYSYFINGVGGVGKTTLAYEIGKKIANSNEGTLIITCGREPKPKHIEGAFYDVAPTFKAFINIVKELTTNKDEYPDTKFIAIDSVDEFCRITEKYVVDEWNASCDVNERVKTINQAYKGYQKGENRACDLMITYLGQLEDAGYKLILIGHTKIKTKEDIYSGLSYEQITCNLDNKYYNALKDKVNLVATCYLEKTITDIEEKKNAFTKKMDKIGNLTNEKRVIVFRDDDMAIDTKSHFKYIVPKVEFSTDNFIKAIEDALNKQANEGKEKPKSKPKVEETPAPETTVNTVDIDDEPEIDEEDIFTDTDEEPISKKNLMSEIREKFSKASKDTKLSVKKYLVENADGKLNDALTVEQLKEIKTILE